MRPALRIGLVCVALMVATAIRADETINRLKQVGLAVAMYADDHDNHMPDMTSAKTAMNDLLTYVSSNSNCFQSISGEPFVPVKDVEWQGVNLEAMYYESKPKEGYRAVLFNDGHVEKLAEDKWQELRKKQKIPDTAFDLMDKKLANLAIIGKGLLEYAKDGDKTLPPLNKPDAMKKALLPYTGMKDVFSHPDSKQPYGVNVSLAGRKLASITNPEKVIVFFEADSADDKRGVLYLNGKVEQISEAQWDDLKKSSGIH